jgi:3-phosphoshikimate 1-carboxyvinyltransferase
MSMAIAGLVSTGGVEVDDISPINTSFPTFMGLLAEAAAR